MIMIGKSICQKWVKTVNIEILFISATVQMKVNTILKLTVTITNTNCEDIRDAYREHYLAGLNTVNYEYYEVLCGTSVCDVPQMTCDASIPDKGTVVIPFGLLPYVHFATQRAPIAP